MSLRYKAARCFPSGYFWSGGPASDFNIVLYDESTDPERYPHDWQWEISRRDWCRVTGGRVLPPREGHIEIELTAKIIRGVK